MERVAVTYFDGKIFKHFGKCKFFKIYDIDNNRITNTNIIPSNGVSHCELVKYIVAQKVSTIICGNMGYPMQVKFNELNIKIIGGVEGDPDNAILQYINGTLVGKEEFGSDCKCEH